MRIALVGLIVLSTTGLIGTAGTIGGLFTPELHAHFRSLLKAPVDDVRRRLHATDESGRLIVGADVVIAIWRLTPGERWLASIAGNPVILPATRFVYDRFADLLFAWNKHKGHW